MKFLKKCLSLVFLSFLCFGCTMSQEAFQEIDVSAQELQEKLDAKEDFVLIIEREGCSYCEAIDSYIETTQEEHPGIVLYRLDITDFDLARQKEDDMTLVSQSEEGQILLDMAPYFLYTPTLYIIENGEATQAGIGYDETTKEVSLWDVDSTIDFDQAKGQEFWSFVESGQAE